MLKFDSISFAYHKTPVLTEVSFSAAPGQVTCVVGPSGCGKSTLLGLAAGLLTMQTGEIWLDDHLLAGPTSHETPEQRPVGLVFQEGALFPHLNVAQNVGFGVAKAKRNARVRELLALVGLSQEADRLPHTLSGGQRQRVALARALAPRPRVLLFDEPYANLDQELRRSLRIEARERVRESGTIGVFVTHDPEDVMALADQVVVLEEGRVLQAGSPRELFDHPASASVARLFGLAQGFPAKVAGNILQTPFGEWPLNCLSTLPEPGSLHESDRLDLCVRPETLQLEQTSQGQLLSELRIAGADDLAEVINAHGKRLYVRLTRPHSLRAGCQVRVVPAPGSVLLLPY